MLNFVYCFDKNYSRQAFVSIFSILENINQKINFHILTDEFLNINKFPKILKNHHNVGNFNFYEVKLPEMDLYNLENAHVTEATFYRLFFEDYFNKVNEYYIYLDCDIICIQNPSEIIEEIFQEMKKNNLGVAFNTEILRAEDEWYFKNLDLIGTNYFNAGVMIFNVESWFDFNVKKKSLELIPKLTTRAKFWDQDILNKIFDQHFYELPKSLNFRDRDDKNKDIFFYHFAGKFKPWTIKGINQTNSQLFHSYYEKLFKRKFLIVTNNFRNAISQIKIELKSDSKIKLSKKRYYYYMSSLFINLKQKLLKK